MRKFTLQKKRELFKYKDFILAVRSHNRVRSLDLSMAELNDIIFLPPKNSLCRLCTVPVSYNNISIFNEKYGKTFNLSPV